MKPTHKYDASFTPSGLASVFFEPSVVKFFSSLILLLVVFAASAAQPTNSFQDPGLKTITTRLGNYLTNSVAQESPPAIIPIAASNSLPSVATPLDDKHKLAIGDRLSFRIAEDEEDPKPLVVTDSGELEVPFLGRVPAENKTCKQLANEIKAGLEKTYYYEATVSLAVDLLAKTRGRVYLVGAVRMPGPQEIPTDEVLTLSKAILRGGSFTEFSDKRNVKITRKTGPAEADKQTFVVDVGEIYDKGRTELDIPLEPGDLILIPDRKIRF